MKIRIIPATIFALGLAASIDASFTSCSCNKSNVQKYWVEKCDIAGDGVIIQWSYPDLDKPLFINYEFKEGYKNLRWSAYYQTSYISDRSDITKFIINHADIKQIEVPAVYVWGVPPSEPGAYRSRMYSFSLGLQGLKE